MHNDNWRALNFLAQCLLMISKQQTLRADWLCVGSYASDFLSSNWCISGGEAKKLNIFSATPVFSRQA